MYSQNELLSALKSDAVMTFFLQIISALTDTDQRRIKAIINLLENEIGKLKRILAKDQDVNSALRKLEREDICLEQTTEEDTPHGNTNQESNQMKEAKKPQTGKIKILK